MKRLLLLLVVVLSTTTIASAQLLKFGAKAGVNMNSTNFSLGDANSADNVLDNVKNNAGFHMGLSAQVNLIGLYVQGDALFVKDSYSYEVKGYAVDVNETHLDIPVVVGLKLLFFRVYAGPRFIVALGDNLKNTVDEISNLSLNNDVLAYQAGVGVDIFSHFTLDFNYNGYFKAPTQTFFIGEDDFTVKNKNKQFWISLGYNF